MTTTRDDIESSALAEMLTAAPALRARFRDRLEQEYLRLRNMDGAEGADRDLIDRRIASIHDYLGFIHEQHAENGICAECCVVIDVGDGPRTVLITAVDVVDDDVVAAGSALGRALLGARPGDRVQLRTATGPRIARVLAVQG